MANKKINIIMETKNYEQFKQRDNRPVDVRRVRSAEEQILATNKKCVLPIAVTPQGVIRDGQHRLDACRNLDIPVRFFITSEISAKHVPIIQGGKKWSPLDHIVRQAKLGNPTYKYIYNAYKDCAAFISASTLGVLFIGKAFTSKILTDNFTLSSVQKNEYKKYLGMLQEIFIEGTENLSAIKTENWVKIMLKLLRNPKYNHKHFLNRIASAGENQFVTSRQMDIVCSKILEIYNYGLKDEDKILIL